MGALETYVLDIGDADPSVAKEASDHTPIPSRSKEGKGSLSSCHETDTSILQSDSVSQQSFPSDDLQAEPEIPVEHCSSAQSPNAEIDSQSMCQALPCADSHSEELSLGTGQQAPSHHKG